jgi:hypothetical protein
MLEPRIISTHVRGAGIQPHAQCKTLARTVATSLQARPIHTAVVVVHKLRGAQLPQFTLPMVQFNSITHDSRLRQSADPAG